MVLHRRIEPTFYTIAIQSSPGEMKIMLHSHPPRKNRWVRFFHIAFVMIFLSIGVACTRAEPTSPTPLLVSSPDASPSQPLPAPPVAVQPGELLYRENFSTNTWGWTEREDGTRQILDGVYHIDETKSPYGWLTQSNPRLLLDTSRAPHLDQPYEISVDVTLPPDLTLYALGIESNVQTLTIAGREEVVAHTFTLRSNNTWIYAGGAGDATASVYRTGILPTSIELRDGVPHRLTLQFVPHTNDLQITFLIDGVIVATLNDLHSPTPELAPFFQTVNGTVGITLGVTTDLIITIMGTVPLRLAADIDTVEIHALTRKTESGTQDAD